MVSNRPAGVRGRERAVNARRGKNQAGADATGASGGAKSAKRVRGEGLAGGEGARAEVSIIN